MIGGFIVTTVVGVICIILGTLNTKGNISSLHSYHRHRVSEEDALPFGKHVGAGTIIVGAGVILMGISMLLVEVTGISVFVTIGTALMFIGLISGLIIAFRAMKKYNKEIF